MIRRTVSFVAVAALLALALAPDAEAARKRYGYSRFTSLGQESGFFIFAELGVANPRNTDSVAATVESVQDFGGGVNTVQTVIPEWDDDPAGRVGFGYRWAGGAKIVGSVWGFDTDSTNSGNGPLGGFVHFAIGPPIFTGGDYVGDSGSPGFFDIKTELTATLVDVAFAKSQEVGDNFGLEWSVGLRYADFEEELSGVYDDVDSTSLQFGQDRYAAHKRNEGDMLGVRAAVRGSYRFGDRLSVGAGLGLSFLDGEVTSTSSLVPTGVANAGTTPSSFATLSDDSRSGRIRDFEIFGKYEIIAGRLDVWGGWEQATWEDLVSDLQRNFAGTAVPLRDRDSLTFSGFKLGMSYLF